MMRGDVYDARLSPTEGSEQAGMRPVVIVSRNAINQHSPVIVVVPLIDAANLRRTYPSDVLIRRPEGGLTLDSVALTGQVRAIAKTRLLRQRGALSSEVVEQVVRALRVTMDL